LSAFDEYLQRIEKWDTKTFLTVYKSDFSTKSKAVAKFFSFFGSFYFWGLIWLAWFIYGYITKDYYLLVIFTGGFEQSIIIHSLVRYKLVKRNRPYITLQTQGVRMHDDFIRIPYFMADSERKSFPSGHVAFVILFGTIFSVYFNNPLLFFIFTAVSIIIGVSRLILGVHYPIDVIFGFVFGLLYALLYIGLTYHFWIDLYYWLGPIISNIVHFRFF
jgi:membrane-associated phospholipid phosphatase